MYLWGECVSNHHDQITKIEVKHGDQLCSLTPVPYHPCMVYLPTFTIFYHEKKPTVNIPYMDPQGVEPTTKNMQLTDDHLAPGRKPQVGFLYWSLWGWSWRTETWSPETRGDPGEPCVKNPGGFKGKPKLGVFDGKDGGMGMRSWKGFIKYVEVYCTCCLCWRRYGFKTANAWVDKIYIQKHTQHTPTQNLYSTCKP